MLRVCVCVSGGGTNLQAIIDAIDAGRITNAQLVSVISNNKGAYALERAKNKGIDTACVSPKDYENRALFNEAFLRCVDEARPDLIVLAGFLVVLPPAMIQRYEGRIINVHPALIPSFCGKGYYGLRVHEAALERGVKVTGATVHFVNEIPDGGEIIMQKAVEVLEGDTPEVLQKRVMEQAEWKILPEACEKVCKKIIDEKGKVNSMDIYSINNIKELIKDNSYVGRGIVIGKSKSGKKAVTAYFIMGRSANSRNRVFVERDNALFTEPFDASKVEDPSLIIYAAVRRLENKLIVTNGDQTDTIYDGIKAGKSFSESLTVREFEPDRPNFTPRISGIINLSDGDFSYEMSILKSADAEGSACNRYTFSYPSIAGLGHFIHTYVCDGNPIPTFQGEPERVEIPDDIDEFTAQLWEGLNEDNKISLYVDYIDLETGKEDTRLINKNK